MEKVQTPKIKDSVFIGFVSDGEGQRVKGASLIPWDKVEQVYDHRESTTSGKPVYQVRVASGDVVKVVLKEVEHDASGNEKAVSWAAVA